jgi:hypothetical protein
MMGKWQKLGILIGLMYFNFYAKNSVASAHCDKGRFDPETSRGKVYSFSLSKVCYFNQIDTVSLQDRFKTHMEENPHITVHRVRQTEFTDNMSGYNIELEERIKTEHGSMKVTAVVMLMSNNVDKFVYDYKATEITGSGHAANTQYTHERSYLEHENNIWKLTISKDIKVLKPWIAPKSIFINEVKKGMQNNMKNVVEKNIKIIEAT